MALLTLILSLALGATYLGVGAYKMLTPRDKLLSNKNMGWAADYPDRTVKGIGLAEVLGAIGLFVPWYGNFLPVLTPIAAVGLTIVQALAIPVHLRRGEARVAWGGNLSLLLLALAVAVLRFYQLSQGGPA